MGALASLPSLGKGKAELNFLGVDPRHQFAQLPPMILHRMGALFASQA